MKHVHIQNNPTFEVIMKEVFIPSKLTHQSSYQDYEAVAQKYLDTAPEETKEFILGHKHLADDDLVFPKQVNQKAKTYFSLAFHNFQCVLKNILTNYKPDFEQQGAVVKSGLNPSSRVREEFRTFKQGRGYALLFE